MSPLSLDLPKLLFVTTLMLLRYVNSRSPFYERLFVGLRLWRAPTRADMDDVLAAPTEEALESRMRDVFDASRAHTWEPIFTSPAMSARLPLSRMAWLNPLAALASMCALCVVGTICIGVVECARDKAAWIVDALLVAVLGSAVTNLLGAHHDLPWTSVEGVAGRYLGVTALVGTSLAFVFTYMANPATAAIDLGSRLRAALEGLDIPTRSPWSTAPPAALVLLTTGVAVVVGVGAVVFVQPALRVGKFYSDSLAAATRGKRPRLDRSLLRVWFYTPLLLALAWLRAFGAQSVLPNDAMLCMRGDLSRDCRAHYPDAPREGGTSWYALLPLPLLSMVVPDFSAAIVANAWVSESSWLRLRAAGVVLFAILQLALLPSQLKIALATSYTAQQAAIRRAHKAGPAPLPNATVSPSAAVPVAKLGAGRNPAPQAATLVSNFTLAAIDALVAECDHHACNALVVAPMVAVQLLAVPAVFGSLALLLVRRGGLGGVGLCSATRAAVGAVPPVLAEAVLTGIVDSFLVTRTLLGRVLGPYVADEVVDLTLHLGESLLEPAFWRPVLSFTLAALLFVYAAELEIALLYWRITDNESHANAAAARKPIGTADVPAAAAATVNEQAKKKTN